jgi:DNA-directed RNA polymerase specialized sigma24 family protein
MTIWETARGLPIESKASVWIFRIAHQHASRFVGCHTPRRLAYCEREGQLRDLWTETKMHRSLLRALRRLPTEQRVVLTLGYRMGYSAREIASITDSQLETVELRMFQARGRLRRYLSTRRGGVCFLSGEADTKEGLCCAREWPEALTSCRSGCFLCCRYGRRRP